MKIVKSRKHRVNQVNQDRYLHDLIHYIENAKGREHLSGATFNTTNDSLIITTLDEDGRMVEYEIPFERLSFDFNHILEDRDYIVDFIVDETSDVQACNLQNITCASSLYGLVDVPMDGPEYEVNDRSINNYTAPPAVVKYLNSLPTDTYLLIYSYARSSLEVDVSDVYIGNSVQDLYDEELNGSGISNYGILRKAESNTWDVVECKGRMTNKFMSTALGIKINRRALSDEERYKKEKQALVNKAKKYIRSRLRDYIIPEYGFQKQWATKRFDKIFNAVVQNCYPEMIQYVDYWDDPDELNDIDENAADLIKHDGFPDAMLVDYIESYASFEEVLSDIYDEAWDYTVRIAQDFRIRWGYSETAGNTHTFLYYMDFKPAGAANGAGSMSISQSQMDDLVEYMDSVLPSIRSKYGVDISDAYYDDLEYIKFDATM